MPVACSDRFLPTLPRHFHSESVGLEVCSQPLAALPSYSILAVHMSTEETPLLLPDPDQVAEEEHNVIYTKFSPRRKKTIVVIVSWAGFLPSKFSKRLQ